MNDKDINLMNKKLISLLLAFHTFQSAAIPVPTSPEHIEPYKPAFKVYNAKKFYDTTRSYGSKISPDGQNILITSDEKGSFDLYQININTGQKTLLRESSSSLFPIAWFPDDQRLLFEQDNNGNELYHLYVREENANVRDLTPTPETSAQFLGFSQDKQFFYVLTNERNPKYNDLYQYNSATYERTRIYENNSGFRLEKINHRYGYLIGKIMHSNTDHDLVLINLRDTNKEPIYLGKNQANVELTNLSLAPDGSTLFYGTNAYGEFRAIWEYNFETAEHTFVASYPWDVRFFFFSPSGRYKVTGINQDAQLIARIIDTHTDEAIHIPSLPHGQISSINFSQDESKISFYVNSETSPSNLYVWDITTQQLTQLTQGLSKKINEQDLVASKVVRFPSFDQLAIPALLYKPQQASSSHQKPMMIYVHGGPGGQSTKRYDSTIQYLVNHGYGVLAINNRGSSGYGKTFFHLDDKNHAQGDLQDMLYAKRYVQTLPWVDDNKIGIMGGSYGGFMTVAALAFEPEAFDVGIDIVGVTNWIRTLKSIPKNWESSRKKLYTEIGNPYTEEDYLRSISPLFHAENIIKPLLVVQGANDPRVLKVESDELVTKIQQNGIPVEYIVFDDEGHGFRKKKNKIRAAEAYVTFLDKYLQKK